MQNKDTYTIKNRCKLSLLFLTLLLMSLPIILSYDFLIYEQSKEKHLLSTNTSKFSRDNKTSNSSSDIKIIDTSKQISDEHTKNPHTPKKKQVKNQENPLYTSFPSVAAEEVYTFGRNEGKKYAFLTFDDGPNSVITPQVLKILKDYDVKATFFVLGSNADNNPDILKRIFDEGHAIANHTYSHDYKKIYPNYKVNIDVFQAEVYKTKDTILKIVGSSSSSRVVRFPGGSFESWKEPMKNKLISQGMYYVDWNAENNDGLKHNVSIEEQLNSLTQNINYAESCNKNIVVLMHDSVMKQTTVDALPSIIELIKSKGYTFALIH
ncbi:MAG: polysaccharide deacetylase [Clostridiales bacterium]|nr:polysaccharide deacetylase [Clostridiales bacterium]